MTEELKQADVFKAAVKEGIQEWLDKQFAAFGRWTFYGICSAALGGLAYLAILKMGWVK